MGNGSTHSSRRPVRRKHDVALVNEQNMQTKNAKCKEFHTFIPCLLNEVPNTTKQTSCISQSYKSKNIFILLSFLKTTFLHTARESECHKSLIIRLLLPFFLKYCSTSAETTVTFSLFYWLFWTLFWMWKDVLQPPVTLWPWLWKKQVLSVLSFTKKGRTPTL